MLDLIASLLAAQTAKQAEDVQPASTEVIAQEKVPIVTPVPAIAPPETMPVSSPAAPASIGQALPSVPLREITFSRSVSVEAQPIQQPLSAAQPSQPPEPIKNVVVVSTQLENAERIAGTQKLQPLEKQKNDPPATVVINGSKVENSTQTTGQETKNLTAPTAIVVQTEQPDRNEQSDRPNVPTNAPQNTNAPVEVETGQPDLKRQTPSDRILARQKVLEQRLAEIVAKDNVQKEAKVRENLITRAYETAGQGKFEQARQLLTNPTVSATVRAEAVKTINSLQANSRKVGVAQATEPIRTALKQRQMEQRQTAALRSVPSLPPLPTRTVAVSPASYAATVQSTAVESVPQRAAVSGDRDYSVTNPSPNLQALTGTFPTPDAFTKDQVVYPLPMPAPVTSGYGWRVHPVRGDRRFHAGVDLGAPQGTPVLATQQGKVKVADTLGGYGLAVVLENGNGSKDALYAHLSQMFVRPGAIVKPGAIIGRVGSTGLSTGPHLHYETRKRTASGWATTDPGPQLEAAKVQLERILASARNSSPKQTKG